MKKLKWAAVRGAFDFHAKGAIRFEGKSLENVDGSAGVATGIALCDERFAGGVITADITFDGVDPLTDCEIVFWYHPERTFFVCAGLSAEPFAMYSIKSFDHKWTYVTNVGEGTSLESGKRYQVRVSLRGSRVGFSIDGVDVLAGTLPYPLTPSQVGIFCRGRHTIRVENYAIQSETPRVFVAMEFKSPFDELHHDVLKIVCKEFGLEAVRADETYGPGIIIADIERQIDDAKFVIAEITPANPNVYYEVGYARARRKPTILLADKTVEHLPFDVSPFRTLFYENSIGGKAKVEEALRRHIRAVLSDSSF